LHGTRISERMALNQYKSISILSLNIFWMTPPFHDPADVLRKRLNHKIQGVSPPKKATRHGTPKRRKKNTDQPCSYSFECPIGLSDGKTPILMTIKKPTSPAIAIHADRKSPSFTRKDLTL
jgi:hypothetical protein